MARLSDKQEAFVLAYLGPARFNATKAAEIAGYSAKDPSRQGHELLKNPLVSGRISEALTDMAIPAEAVLSELTDVATADWREFVTVRTNSKTGETIDVRMDLSSKVKALELMGKAYGLFTERVDISGTMTSKVEMIGISVDDV